MVIIARRKGESCNAIGYLQILHIIMRKKLKTIKGEIIKILSNKFGQLKEKKTLLTNTLHSN